MTNQPQAQEGREDVPHIIGALLDFEGFIEKKNETRACESDQSM